MGKLARSLAGTLSGPLATKLNAGPAAGVPSWLRDLAPTAVMGWDFRTNLKYRMDQSAFTRADAKTLLIGAGARQSFVSNTLARAAVVGASLERSASSRQRNSEDMGGSGWSALPPTFTKSGDAVGGFIFTQTATETGVFRTMESGYDAIAALTTGYFAFDLHNSGRAGAAVWVSNVGYIASFDAAATTATSLLAGATATIADIGGGWRRCFVSFAQPTSAGTFWRIKMGTGGGGTNYTAGDFYKLRAPQIELDRFSSYIPTTITGPGSVARAADALTLALRRSGNHTIKALLSDASVQTLSASAATTFAIDAAALNRPGVLAVWAEAA